MKKNDIRPVEKVYLVSTRAQKGIEPHLLHILDWLVNEGYIMLIQSGPKVVIETCRKHSDDMRVYEKEILNEIYDGTLSKSINHKLPNKIRSVLNEKNYFQGFGMLTRRSMKFRKEYKKQDFVLPDNELLLKYYNRLP